MKGPDNFTTLRAIELTRRGIEWLPLGVLAAPAWFGRSFRHAANDEHFK